MSDFFYGVIEGFYGRQWRWQDRTNYAGFLKEHGFGSYIYAPKGDEYLRSAWREKHPAKEWQQLLRLSEHYRSKGVSWGLGFSPLGMLENYSVEDRACIKQKIQHINALSPDILCILFDDTRGDIEGLADRQLEIVSDILNESNAAQHIVCPTYYSLDPVLEQVFGAMPEGYLDRLGGQLPKEIGIFWTGNKVIAESFEQKDIESITQIFNRKPIIWDNYPVNDGKLTSRFLNLKPYSGRPHGMRNWCGGHIVNPMNQPYLSQIALHSLGSIYKQGSGADPTAMLEDGLGVLQSDALAQQLTADINLFQQAGLDAMTDQLQEEKIKLYKAFSHPAADEIVDWLEGGYRFDPDCLTG